MEHTELLNKLATQLEIIGLTLYEHAYYYQVFGSWHVIVGKPHDRMRFSWDGKESYLGVTQAQFSNSNSIPVWEPDLDNSLGIRSTPIEVFDFIAKRVAERYGT